MAYGPGGEIERKRRCKQDTRWNTSILNNNHSLIKLPICRMLIRAHVFCVQYICWKSFLFNIPKKKKMITIHMLVCVSLSVFGVVCRKSHTEHWHGMMIEHFYIDLTHIHLNCVFGRLYMFINVGAFEIYWLICFTVFDRLITGKKWINHWPAHYTSHHILLIE